MDIFKRIALTGAFVAVFTAWNSHAGMTHRYSFNDPDNPGLDSIGSADATLMKDAFIVTGGLNDPSTVGKSGVRLDNSPFSADGGSDYVELPQNVLTGATNLTVEFWTDLGDDAWQNAGTWSRVFDFGDPYTVKGEGRNFLTFIAHSGEVPATAEALFDIDQNGDHARCPNTLEGYHHVVLSINASAGFMELFVDGYLASHTVTSNKVTDIATNAMWLGRSEWLNDAYLYGYIDEFRIYNHPLSGVEAGANFIAGSDEYNRNTSKYLGRLLQVNLAPIYDMVEKTEGNALATGDFEQMAGLSLVNAPGFVFKSSNPSVATIDQGGLIRALKPGMTTISGTYSNKTDSFPLTVDADTTPPAMVNIDTLGYDRFIQVTFSKPLDPKTAQDPANYSLDSSAVVNRAVLSADGLVVRLWTSQFDLNRRNTLTVNGVVDTDYTPNVIDHATISFGTAPGDLLLARCYFKTDGYTVDTIQDAMTIPGFPVNGGVLASCSTPGLSDGYPRRYEVETIQGFLFPPTDGAYTFAISSIGDSQFYLSIDDTEAGLPAAPTLQQTGYRNPQAYSGGDSGTMATLNLIGGNRYFFRAYHQTRGGFTSFDVTWQKPGDPDIWDGQPAIEAQYLQPVLSQPRPLVITNQPQDISVVQNTDATFTVGVDSWPYYTSVQWYKSNALGVVAIPVGGNARGYTAPIVGMSDNGASFWAVVSNTVDIVTTRAARLTVTPDTVAPKLVGAVAGMQVGPSATNVTVWFNKRMDLVTAIQASHYSMSGASSPKVTSVTFDNATKTTVCLGLDSPLAEKGAYKLTATDVKDLAGNTIDPAHNSIIFYAAAWANPGQFVIDIYDNYNLGVDAIAGDMNSLTPSRTLYYNDMGTLETEHGDNFAAVAEGALVPPETGDYIFVLNSDNSSRLFLSPDDSPANLPTTDICGIDGWTSGLNDWNGSVWGDYGHSHQSQPITLIKGARYYYRVTWAEDVGYDYLQIGWQTPSNPDTTLIPGSALLTMSLPAAPLPLVAGVLDLGTLRNASIAFPAAKLASRATGGSGPRSILAVSSTSAQGGAVSMVGSLITYVPPTDFLGVDSFNYTLSDGLSMAQGTVPVTVTSQKAPARNTLTIARSGGGMFVEFLGIPNLTYLIQTANSIAGPWTDLSGPITAGPTGLITYTDTHPSSTKFYRTRVNP